MFLAEFEYEPLEKTCNVYCLVSPAWPEDGKDELFSCGLRIAGGAYGSILRNRR